MLKHPARVGGLALLVAWGFDFLFWEKTPGLSFLLFTALLLGAGLFLAWVEGVRPAAASLWLGLPVAFFALFSFLRLEPFTLLLDYCLGLVFLALLAYTFRGGRWWQFSLSDYLVGLLKLGVATLVAGAEVYSSAQRQAGPGADIPVQSPAWRRLVPVGRGLLLALPVLAVFSALLASADPIFSDRITQLTHLLRIENLPTYLFRVFYISILAYFLVGIYSYALLHSDQDRLIGQDKPWLNPFLGFTEAAVVLGSVNALFAFFVLIQVQYFFGGRANINLAGYTFAEYARRGFGELVIVAFFSLVLFFSLSAVTRRETEARRRAFSALGVALVLLVGVILGSAYQRLVLYEAAYGFSRLRTYTHIFMVWLGLLLLALVVLETIRRPRVFALAALLAGAGFGASLNLVNVDAFIVRQNVQRAVAGEALDTAYLASLSEDAVPTLFALHASAGLPADVRQEIGGVLACRAALTGVGQANSGYNPSRQASWQSFHLAKFRAGQLMERAPTDLAAYPTSQDQGGMWRVQVAGQEHSCTDYGRVD